MNKKRLHVFCTLLLFLTTVLLFSCATEKHNDDSNSIEQTENSSTNTSECLTQDNNETKRLFGVAEKPLVISEYYPKNV